VNREANSVESAFFQEVPDGDQPRAHQSLPTVELLNNSLRLNRPQATGRAGRSQSEMIHNGGPNLGSKMEDMFVTVQLPHEVA